MDLNKMVRDDAVSIDDIAQALDALSHAERVEQTFSLGRTGQRALYEKAGRAPAISFEHFVPSSRGPREAVHHHGRNTLPLPSSHKLFQKRFCRPDDDSARLFGYNEAPSGRWIGPGYFVAIPTEPEPDWRPRGAIVVDYFQVPDGPVVSGWPRVVPNTAGLQRFVYHRTRDFMRRVSNHVSIGAAYKVEKPLDHYFVLVRED